jgi:uncharacterized protein YdhG (YjbR/CyaY superfamily)
MTPENRKGVHPLLPVRSNQLRIARSSVEKAGKKSRTIKPGGVDEYIAEYPREVQDKLRDMRAAIREVAPDAIETVSYFEMPGYSYEGYVYNGMFAWLSFKAPCVRLHVYPEALANHKTELEKYTTTKAIVSFPADGRIPKALVKKPVKSSLKAMKGLRK